MEDLKKIIKGKLNKKFDVKKETPNLNTPQQMYDKEVKKATQSSKKKSNKINVFGNGGS